MRRQRNRRSRIVFCFKCGKSFVVKFSEASVKRAWRKCKECNCLGHPGSSQRLFTDQQVVEMRKMYADGATVSQVAKQFGATNRKASTVIGGRKYKNLPGACTHRLRSSRGSDHPLARLDEETVIEIRELIAQGHSFNDVKLRFVLTVNQLSKIIHRRTWRHV